MGGSKCGGICEELSLKYDSNSFATLLIKNCVAGITCVMYFSHSKCCDCGFQQLPLQPIPVSLAPLKLLEQVSMGNIRSTQVFND